MIERALENVRDVRTGRDYLASEFFAQSEGEIFRERRSCAEGTSTLVCALCNQKVYIAGTPRQEFIFKHYQERGDCPIKTAGRFSQEELDRMRYAGQRESELHKQLKNEIGDALMEDATRCQNVRIEGVRHSSADPRLWRRPDVSCEFLGKKIVFEVQLSTTYLNVIVEREAHYREDRTYVIWLFANFDPADLKFIHKDVLYSNYGNLFVFDEKARRRSADEKKLIIHSYQFIRPTITTPAHWTDQFVDLSELAYEETAFRTHAPCLAKKQLVVEFESYWPTRQALPALDRSENDKHFADRFAEFGIKFDTWRTPRLLDSLYSLRTKSIVGFAYKPFSTGLIQIAHRLFDSRKKFFRPTSARWISTVSEASQKQQTEKESSLDVCKKFGLPRMIAATNFPTKTLRWFTCSSLS